MKNILPIILIAIAIAGFFMFTSPMYDSLSETNAKISSYNEALNNAQAIDNERDKLTKKFNSIDPSNLDKLQKLLPDGVDNIRLILEIEELARPYGMVLKDVKYATDTNKANNAPVQGGAAVNTAQKDYGDWDLEFSTQGTYANFLSFAKDLENNLRIVDIVGVDFSSDNGGVSPTINEAYKYNIKIKTYWLKN